MEAAPLRVGIVANSPRHRKTLSKILADNGLDVVAEEILRSRLPDKINLEIADVLLINLDDTDESGIEMMIDGTELPILFNDSASIRKSTTVSGKAWGNRLAKKLLELTQNYTYTPGPSTNAGADSIENQSQEVQGEQPPSANPDLHLVESELQIESDQEISIMEDMEISIPAETWQGDEITLSTLAQDEQDEADSVELEDFGLHLENFDTSGGGEDGVQSDSPDPIDLENISYDGGMDYESALTDENHQPNKYVEVDVTDMDAAYNAQDTKSLDLLAAAEELLPNKAHSTKLEESVKEAKQVWVLGASIGGPEAVKRFLAALPANMPVGFVLAQHIGAGFVALLAVQLGRVSSLQVSGGEEDMILQENHLLVAPVEKRLTFNAVGSVVLKPVNGQSIYSPSIDDVLIEVSKRFGARANAIIFSGMGNDGTKGSRVISEQGGLVWAQTADTCVISSMVDSVRDTGIVTYTASPEDLAYHLVKHLGIS